MREVVDTSALSILELLIELVSYGIARGHKLMLTGSSGS